MNNFILSCNVLFRQEKSLSKNNNKILLETIMGCKLTTYPSNSEFVYSMEQYLVKQNILHINNQ